MWNENTTEIQYTYIKPLVLESISHSTLLTPHSSKTKYFQIILFFPHLFVSLHTDNKSTAIAEDHLFTNLYQYGRLPGG